MERAQTHTDPFEMREKGSREWRSVGEVIRERHVDAYPGQLPRLVHLPVMPAAPDYRELFILKRLHTR